MATASWPNVSAPPVLAETGQNTACPNQGEVPATLPAVDMAAGLESERCDDVLPALVEGEQAPVAVRSHPH